MSGSAFSRYEQFETSPKTIKQDCDLQFGNCDIHTYLRRIRPYSIDVYYGPTYMHVKRKHAGRPM